VEFALNQSHLIGVLVGEPDRLPEKESKAARQTQRDCLALWVRLLDEVRPDLDAAEAKIVVNAMLTMVDNVPRTGRLGERTSRPASRISVRRYCSTRAARPRSEHGGSRDHVHRNGWPGKPSWGRVTSTAPVAPPTVTPVPPDAGARTAANAPAAPWYRRAHG
jgi:hypothetical protein